MTNFRVVRAPTGPVLNCKGWLQEAAYRMLQNNLDPDNAEHPEALVVYGGRGKAARNWQCFDKTLQALRLLKDDETLLMQSGKPIGILTTTADSPRVLLANSNLVPHWATWEVFDDLDKKGLMMYGQMTAGSWIYIGTQGIIQGTFETFAQAGRTHFGGSLKGRSLLTAGLGGMGGAQPLAAVFAGACVLAVEVDSSRIERRLKSHFVDEATDSLTEAVAKIQAWKQEGVARSIALHGNMADVIQKLVAMGFVPDLLTDQTSAHDPLMGYVPMGLSLAEVADLRLRQPQEVVRRAKESMAVHVRAMLELRRRGAVTFDYGNNIRAQALDMGVKDAFDIAGFVPEYIRPLFCRGSGPFRWVALSGDPQDIAVTDQALKELFPNKSNLIHWLDMAQRRIAFQGLPARICWLEYGERAKAGLLFNELVRSKRVKAPIVIGRDHLDCGSVASPYRETEAMKDGSDAIADWPILNALVNTACGATWVSYHHGGGVGMGYSLHAGQVIVADGTPQAQARLQRVLTADPAMGLFRHIDAGYETAIEVGMERGVRSLWYPQNRA